MTHLSEPLTTGASCDQELAAMLDQVAARLQAGEPVDADQFVADHPNQAERLRQLLPSLQLLAGASRPDRRPIVLPVDGEDALYGTLGDFRLIREVGRGGMGVVYEAEQISLCRRVALKVLPFAATMDPRQLQRFRNEAQAAACLHHTNIVPVYGVGCERAVHFYAMQLIEGQSLAAIIDDFRLSNDDCKNLAADAAGLPIENRQSKIENRTTRAALTTKRDKTHFRRIAELIAQAADALEYAHSMGVVHRDIKPANLMLDDAGHLWVTDFGLAKLQGPDREGGMPMTMTGDMIGTLRYMSPEQALAKHGLVDHRTDVYSLGATLYELLTLRPAVDGADKHELLKKIAFEEPTPLRKHDKSIPAELETITLKSLAKEPGERYATAGEFAEDLRQWLGDKAIKARPPGVREKVAKWGRRHKGVVGAAVAMLILAATGFALSTWLIWREQDATRVAKDKAELNAKEAGEQAAIATAVQDFLLDDLLNQADSREQTDRGFAGNPKITLTEAVDRAAARIDDRFPDQPRVKAAVHFAIGDTYIGLGEPKQAIHHLEAACEIRMACLGPDHDDTLSAMNSLSGAYEAVGKLDLAISLFKQTLDLKKAKLGLDHPNTLITMGNLAGAYREAGRLDLALPLFEETLKLEESKLGLDNPGVLITRNNLVLAYVAAGKFDLAERLIERTVAAMTAAFGPDHPDTLVAMNNFAGTYQNAGKVDLALPLYQRALAGQKKRLPANHPETLKTMSNLGDAYREANQLDRALPLLKETLQLRKNKLGPEHFDTLVSMNNLGSAHRATGELDLALPLFREAAEGMERRKFAHEFAVRIVSNLCGCYEQMEDFDNVEIWQRKWLASLKEKKGPESAEYASQLAVLGWKLIQRKKYADAEPILRECHTIRTTHQSNAWTTFNTKSLLGGSLLGQKKHAESESLLLEGYEGMKQRENLIAAEGKIRLIEALDRLVQLYDATAKPEKAAQWRKKLEALRAVIAQEKKP